MQPTRAHTSAYRTWLEPNIDQLPPGYDPVLPVGKAGDRLLPLARPQ